MIYHSGQIFTKFLSLHVTGVDTYQVHFPETEHIGTSGMKLRLKIKGSSGIRTRDLSHPKRESYP